MGDIYHALQATQVTQYNFNTPNWPPNWSNRYEEEALNVGVV